MIFGLVLFLLAGPVEKSVADGNAAWHAKRYEEAVAYYQKALGARPDSPEVLYNLGDALYRTGDFARALENFDRAARLGGTSRTVVLARYNAGNSAFQVAMGAIYSDPQGTLKLLERAIGSFEQAHKMDPKMENAAHNAEVARKWLELLKQQFAQPSSQGYSLVPQIPGMGRGPSVRGILGRDQAMRPGAGSGGRPVAVDKDW